MPPIVVAIIWKVLYTPDISPLWWLCKQLGWDMPARRSPTPDWALTAIIVADRLAVVSVRHADGARRSADACPRSTSTPRASTAPARSRSTALHHAAAISRGVLLVAGLFRLIDSIKAFPLIYILTRRRPRHASPRSPTIYSFIQAFNFSYLGYSSAITVVLMADHLAC